jgi:hypothetical protein
MQHSHEALDRPGGFSRVNLLTPLRHRDYRLLWAGMTVSLACMLAIKFYSTPPHMEINLAWTWYVITGTLICTTVGYLVSLTTTSTPDIAPKEDRAIVQ